MIVFPRRLSQDIETIDGLYVTPSITVGEMAFVIKFGNSARLFGEINNKIVSFDVGQQAPIIETSIVFSAVSF